MWLRPAAVIAASLLGFGMAGCAASNGSSHAGTASGGTTTGPSMGGTASSPALSSAEVRALAATCPESATVTPMNVAGAKVVPADLSVAWVLRCRILSTGGNPTALVAERSTSDVSKLVTALKAPPAQRAKVVCPMIAVQVPYFALVLADGTVFHPRIPTNNCGQPQSDVLTALNTLRFSEITTKPIR
jgi:hypothetical protein